MPTFKNNTSSAMKSSGFKMKSSPAKLFGMGKSARQKRARKYELEDRATREEENDQRAITGHGGR